MRKGGHGLAVLTVSAATFFFLSQQASPTFTLTPTETAAHTPTGTSIPTGTPTPTPAPTPAPQFYLWAWGNNYWGQTDCPDQEPQYQAIGAGATHSVAVKSDGSLVAWGDNRYAQTDCPSGNDYVKVVCTAYANLAIKQDASLVGWGIHGRLGLPEGTDFITISSTNDLFYLTKADGTILVGNAAWGWDTMQEIIADHSGMVAGRPPEGHTVFELFSYVNYGNHLFFLDDASLFLLVDSLFPDICYTWPWWWTYDEEDFWFEEPFVAMDIGVKHGAALRADSSLFSLGASWFGANETPSGAVFKDVRCGNFHSVGLRNDGSLAAWGFNYTGECDVPPGNSVVAVAVGSHHALALCTEPKPPEPTPTPVWSDTGWAEADGKNCALAGLVMYGRKDPVKAGIAALPASTTLEETHYLPHFASDSIWFTGVAVANPSTATDAHVTLSAFSNTGTAMGTPANWTVPARGKRAETFRSLFPGQSGTGWVKVESDTDVLVFNLYGNTLNGGLAALPSCEPRESLVLPHFLSNTSWWTGVAVLNPGATQSLLTLKAFDRDGTSIQENTFNVDARSKLVAMVEGLLPLTEGKEGWLVMETSAGNPVAACLVFGKRGAVPSRIAALSAAPASSQIYLSSFVSDTDWWTGVAIVNPSINAAHITMTAYAQDGTPIDTVYPVLPSLNKTLGFAKHLVTLNGRTKGWIQATSDQPIIGLEILNATDDIEEAWGLAGISSQPSVTRLYMTHYAVASPWWTLFTFANLHESSQESVHLEAFSPEGRLAGTTDQVLPAKESISDHIKALFGVEG